MVDLVGVRNYIVIWVGVNEEGEVFICREWFDRDIYGEWVMFGDLKWKYGLVFKKIGLNVEGYCEFFEEIEEDLGIEVMEWIGDFCFFVCENENNDDFFILFYDFGLSFILFDGKMEDFGIIVLDDWFNYNLNVEIDVINWFRCYIYFDCGNFIDSLINYNVSGKLEEVLKDFFDVICYLWMLNGGEGLDFMLNLLM